ncbi:MAG: preprotein translocase subunit YajC [Bacteroidia bacterium]
MHFTEILLQAQPGGGMGPGVMNFIMIGLIIVVFYFFMLRPQQKKQKEQNNFMSELKKGDKVVTIGGIVGKVLEVRNKSFIIEVEGGGKLQVLKSAISLDFSKSFSNDAEEKKD